MAGDPRSDLKRFEEEIDLEVAFNEFDDELFEYNERNLNNSEEKGPKDSKQGEYKDDMFANDACHHQNETIKKHSVTNENHTGGMPIVGTSEEGEVLSSSDDEGEEKMDFDEDLDEKPVTKSNFTLGDEGTIAKTIFKFLPPDSTEGEGSKMGSKAQELTKGTVASIDEAEREMLSMESDNSMDDQSWKRHKRARMEVETQEHSVERKRDGKDGGRNKTRGGKKKRKRPVGNHYGRGQHQRRHHQEEPELGNLFKPLKVTSEDSEEVVAKEIASKLNEAKTNLIQRVVKCIGCEKALKLFRDTKEVQMHGGMWTKDNQRRRTSGGVFLTILKDRYVTKEQNKWIFAVENEINKKKAKEQQQRLKEVQRKDIEDLKMKLKQRDQD